MRRAAEWATLNKRTSRARSILSEEYFARSSRSSFVGLSRENSIRARTRFSRSSYFVIRFLLRNIGASLRYVPKEDKPISRDFSDRFSGSRDFLI